MTKDQSAAVERVKFSEDSRFYDQGWNARIRGEPIKYWGRATRDWLDGWKDCDELTDEQRAEIGEQS